MAEESRKPKASAKTRSKQTSRSTKSGAGAAGRRRGASAKPERSNGDRMIDAAMKLAAERAWHELSLREIAEASGLSLPEAYQAYPSKIAILEGFLRRIDAAVLTEGTLGPEDGSARDRIFDVLMRRFDALQPYRKALGAILMDQAREPLAALGLLPALHRSMAWMLEAAGLEASGVKGQVRIKALTLVYLGSLRTWLRDDTADQAKTMAALDGYLRRIEALLLRLPRRTSRSGEPSD